MPRKPTKRKRPQKPMPDYYIFEIKELEPSYSLSISFNDRFEKGPYNEHVGITFNALCIHPKKFDGVETRFDICGERDSLEPEIYKDNPDWKPKCVGCLELNQTSGRFYMSAPHDSMSFMLVALERNMFRFLYLYGPPLKWGQSLCSEFRFLQSVNLEDY